MIKHPRLWYSVLALLLLDQCGVSYKNVANLNSSGTTIVCFGDSITRGYGATAGNTYPEQLARLLDMAIVNAGSDGDTTESGLARLDEDVLAHDPRLVIVGLGGNDRLRQVPTRDTFNNLREIVQRITAAGSMVVVVHGKFGLFDDPYLHGMRDIAEEHGAIFVKDALRGILGRPSRMHDQIHPNDAGYALLAERIAAVVEPLLEAARSGS